ALSAPAGVNLMNNASAIGLGLLFAPVTVLWGPLVAFDVAALTSLAATAWSAQVAIRRGLGVRWPAAGAGGLLAGFGPVAVAQAGGAHLHVAAGFLVPPLLLGVARLAAGQARYPGRWGAAIGAVAALQLLVGEEVLAIAGVTALIAIVAATVLAGPVDWRAMAQGGGVAAAVFALLAGWPLA